MKRLSTRAVESRPDRPATQLLHDSSDARVVAFHLQPRQEVAPHRSDSTVVVQVIDGEGEFSGADGETRLTAGEAAAYEPKELHGIRALDSPLRFLAIITPGPP